MKRKMKLGGLIGAMVLAMSLTGCGNKESVEKTETTAEVTTTQDAASTEDVETTEVAGTEATTEEVTTEAPAAEWEALVERYDELFGEIMDYAEEYPDVENLEDLPEDVQERVTEIEEEMAGLEEEIDALIEESDEETALEIVTALQEVLAKYEPEFEEIETGDASTAAASTEA